MRIEELLRRARREGWAVTTRGTGHFQLDHQDASRPVIVPRTPSDRRWWRNALAEMRRALPPDPKAERTSPRVRRKPMPRSTPKPRPIPAIEVELPEKLPLPPRRIAGGPAGYRNIWSTWW
jgi:hypothetical protein